MTTNFIEKLLESDSGATSEWMALDGSSQWYNLVRDDFELYHQALQCFLVKTIKDSGKDVDVGVIFTIGDAETVNVELCVAIIRSLKACLAKSEKRADEFNEVKQRESEARISAFKDINVFDILAGSSQSAKAILSDVLINDVGSDAHTDQEPFPISPFPQNELALSSGFESVRDSLHGASYLLQLSAYNVWKTLNNEEKLEWASKDYYALVDIALTPNFRLDFSGEIFDVLTRLQTVSQLSDLLAKQPYIGIFLIEASRFPAWFVRCAWQVQQDKNKLNLLAGIDNDVDLWEASFIENFPFSERLLEWKESENFDIRRAICYALVNDNVTNYPLLQVLNNAAKTMLEDSQISKPLIQAILPVLAKARLHFENPTQENAQAFFDSAQTLVSYTEENFENMYGEPLEIDRGMKHHRSSTAEFCVISFQAALMFCMAVAITATAVMIISSAPPPTVGFVIGTAILAFAMSYIISRAAWESRPWRIADHEVQRSQTAKERCGFFMRSCKELAENVGNTRKENEAPQAGDQSGSETEALLASSTA